jgi:UDP-2,3-diacylglucosamine pyrophosphatase LpxH
MQRFRYINQSRTVTSDYYDFGDFLHSVTTKFLSRIKRTRNLNENVQPKLFCEKYIIVSGDLFIVSSEVKNVNNLTPRWKRQK